jgi:hypothetical protein
MTGKYFDHPQDGLIYVESGQFWGREGIFNRWRWRVLATNEKKYGIGGRWPLVSDDDPRVARGLT